MPIGINKAKVSVYKIGTNVKNEFPRIIIIILKIPAVFPNKLRTVNQVKIIAISITMIFMTTDAPNVAK